MLSPDHSFVVPSISKDMRALYDSHFAFVWRYMAHRGVPLANIDDLAQNVFRIVREHPSRHDPARSRSVLVCMVSRQVLREYRKRQGPTTQSVDDGDGPTMSFSRHAAGQVLDAVLEGMTETQREVLLLSQGESMSNHDIADALGVPEAVVQQRLEAAAKLMTTLVAKLRAHPIWDALPKSPRDARSLLEAAQKARTPNDADRERVFAGMLAVSMTSAPPANAAAQSAPEVVSMPALSLPASIPAPEPVLMAPPSTVTTQEFPTPKRRKKPLIWGAVAFAAVLFGLGGYAVNSMVYAGDWEKQETDESMGTAVAEAEATPEPAPAEEAPAAEAPAPEPTVEAAPAPEQPAAEAAAAAAAPVKVTKVTVKRRAAARREAREPRAPKVDEARQLFAAERAYRAGETKLAIDMLNDMDRQYPDSKLTTERNALRAQVLCGSGKTKAARRLILELEADQADKPLLAAVDKACTEQ